MFNFYLWIWCFVVFAHKNFHIVCCHWLAANSANNGSPNWNGVNLDLTSLPGPNSDFWGKWNVPLLPSLMRKAWQRECNLNFLCDRLNMCNSSCNTSKTLNYTFKNTTNFPKYIIGLKCYVLQCMTMRKTWSYKPETPVGWQWKNKHHLHCVS